MIGKGGLAELVLRRGEGSSLKAVNIKKNEVRRREI